MKLICPICKQIFTVCENSIKCESGHSFDRAKEGYYNLLVRAGGGNHGDNAEMVVARREFLNTGAYLPLAKRVSELCLKYANGDVIDVGCGEGYYTEKCYKALLDSGFSGDFYAFDISRDAVKRVAKKDKGIISFVASAYSIPFSDAQTSVVLNMFSPLATEEIKRILTPGGKFIMAIPGENHLYSLKDKIYDTPYKNEVKDSYIDGFRLISSEKISYNITLDTKEKIRALFMMTPYAYRTGKVGRERVLSLNTLTTEIEFTVFVYEKI